MAARKGISPRLAIQKWAEAEGKCHWCRESIEPAEVVFDHREPLSNGGDDQPGNLVLSCQHCNATKAQLPARVAELWFHDGLPRCWAISIHRFEQRLPRLEDDPFYTGAEWIDTDDGKRRVVTMPIGGGSCESPHCPDCT